MAVCSGCTGGSSTVNHSDTTCIHLTGDGSLGDPLVATQQIDPTGDNENCINCGPSGLRLVIDPDGSNGLSCGPAGLFAASGGSSTCAQKTIFTVATSGPVGFGADLGTQEPFRSCADFLGDGTNDEVAVQAAVDAAAYVVAGVFPLFLEVQMLNGVYVFSNPVDTKSIPIKGIPNGSTSPATLIYNNIIYGGAGNRLFNNNPFAVFGSPGGMRLQHIGINAGGAAALRWVHAGAGGAQAMYLDDVFIQPLGTSGADPGFIVTDNIGVLDFKNVSFSFGTTRFLHSTSTLSATTVYIKDSIIGSAEYAIFRSGANGVGTSLIHDNYFEGALYFEDTVLIHDNDIRCQNASGISAAIHLVGANNFLIRNNLITNSSVHGILIDGPGGDVSDSGSIVGNRINTWGTSAVNTYDGIIVQNNVQYLYIAGNIIQNLGFTPRYHINLSTSTVLEATVHNNRLRRAGTASMTGYFNDVGTRTMVDLGDHIIRKPSNQTVTSSNVLVSDTALFHRAYGVGEIWELEFVVFYDGSTTGDIKFGLSVPTGATFRMGVHALGAGAAADTFDLRSIAYTTGTFDFGAIGAGTVTMAIIKAMVIIAGTGGDITLQWAQQTADATATTVFANSYMKVRQVR